MENYDLNIHWGIKTIKVTFQIGKYKGYVTYRVKGNTKGASLLKVDADDLYDMTFVDNNAQLKDLGDEWYSMVLKGEHGEELIDEGEWDDLSDYIVAVEIIDMVSEEDQSNNGGIKGGTDEDFKNQRSRIITRHFATDDLSIYYELFYVESYENS